MGDLRGQKTSWCNKMPSASSKWALKKFQLSLGNAKLHLEKLIYNIQQVLIRGNLKQFF